jgi:pSer/pThr/pTyr-binding forkhead associated (FHA) protein
MRCGSCGWDNPAGIIFCTNCGKRMSDRAQPAASAVVTPPSGNVAAGGAVAAIVPASSGGPTPPADDAVRCPRCGSPSARGLRFCRECGSSLSQQAGPTAAIDATPAVARDAASAECWRCHAPRDSSAPFCRHCGAQLEGSGSVASPSSVAQPATSFSMPSMPAAAAFQQPAPSSPHATPHAAASPVASPRTGQARLVTLLKDGSEGRSIPLGEGDADIGSQEGDITFPDDPYLSLRHARICCRAGTYTLRDLDSVNGLYVRLREAVELRDRDMVLIGQQVLRFELLQDGELPLGPAYQRGVLVFGTPEAPRFARLVQYTTEGVGRDVHYLFRDETVIGRENGDIVFTDDPFLSRRHAAIRVDHAGRRFTLHDLGSSNGTAARIRGEHVLRDGDQFRIGRHLFRFEAGAAGGRAGR